MTNLPCVGRQRDRDQQQTTNCPAYFGQTNESRAIMRHRKRGRHFGRTSSHRSAMMKNMISSLFLTERDVDPDLEANAPKVKGRIITTLPKAREIRPLVEKCITIACKSLKAEQAARQYATDADRDSEEWKRWRNSTQWQDWNRAMAPAIDARRRVLRMIGDKKALRILFRGYRASVRES